MKALVHSLAVAVTDKTMTFDDSQKILDKALGKHKTSHITVGGKVFWLDDDTNQVIGMMDPGMSERDWANFELKLAELAQKREGTGAQKEANRLRQNADRRNAAAAEAGVVNNAIKALIGNGENGLYRARDEPELRTQIGGLISTGQIDLAGDPNIATARITSVFSNIAGTVSANNRKWFPGSAPTSLSQMNASTEMTSMARSPGIKAQDLIPSTPRAVQAFREAGVSPETIVRVTSKMLEGQPPERQLQIATEMRINMERDPEGTLRQWRALRVIP
jgi:hypothetical protein